MFQKTISSGNSYVIPINGIMTTWTQDRTGQSGGGFVAAMTATASGTAWTVTAATPYEYIPGSAVTTVHVRIPVSAGQVLGGAAHNSEASMCSAPSSADVLTGNSAFTAGSTFTESLINNKRVNIAATVEPDADGDGYGDQTQDKCPQSAALIDPCPVLKISQQVNASAKKITVLAAASTDTSLTATATVTLSKKKTVTIKSKAMPFPGGSLKTINLALNTPIKSALAKGKKLKATVTVSGSGLANTAAVAKKITLKK
ncbi:MAG: hypothetical protein QM648_05675 [Solirubrobacterales bacterium]